MFAPKTGLHPIALLLIIVVGVTLGNLLSSWISAELLAYEVRQLAVQAAKELSTQSAQARQSLEEKNRQAAASALQRQQAEVALRRNSPEGIRLQQSCTEWRRAEADLPSYTSHAEATRHCGRLDRYLETGERPPRN